ncbi:CBS domain-containing protein [Ensifer sp. Root142]|uniref:CBS domain-containing protein n=2 Tax=Ensifer TaxID=106591 RepID=UPI001FCD8975|nr:CBS domain-containing protein [Ensifer sp. Root142]
MRIEKLYPMTSADVDRCRRDAAGCCPDAFQSGDRIGRRQRGRRQGGGGAQQIRSHSLMSRNIISCSSGDDLQAAWQVMMENRIQNMPVLGNDAKPLGVLDIRDALRVLLFEQEQLQEHMLANYIAGIGY